MNKKVAHIGVSVLNGFQDAGIEMTLGEIKAEGLSLEFEKRRPMPYAAMEWIVPTACFVYIAKSYFDGFLKEAGKDHFLVLKNWLKKVAANGKDVKFSKVTSKGVSDSRAYNQSLTLSLLVTTKNNRTIKLLFDNELSKEDWEEAIDSLLDYVIDNYEKYPNDSLTQNTKQLRQDERFYLYALIDKETKQLVFHDDSTLMGLQTQQKN